MSKITKKKNNVIKKSAKLFYYQGYKNTSLADILTECKIPKGSFYYYFKNKDDLLIHVIKYHTENLISFFDKIVDDLTIIKLRIFFYQYFENIEKNDFHGGSPLGNLAIELSDINEEARKELLASFIKIEMKFSFFLSMLKSTYPDKYTHIEPNIYASTLVSILEGTLLKIKIEKNSNPIEDFLSIFDRLFK